MPQFGITFSDIPSGPASSGRRQAPSLLDTPTITTEELRAKAATIDARSAIGDALSKHGDALQKLGNALETSRAESGGRTLGNRAEEELKTATIKAQSWDEVDAAQKAVYAKYAPQADAINTRARGVFDTVFSNAAATIVPAAKHALYIEQRKAIDATVTENSRADMRRALDAPDGILQDEAVADALTHIRDQEPILGKPWVQQHEAAWKHDFRIGLMKRDALSLPPEVFMHNRAQYDVSDDQWAEGLAMAMTHHNQQYELNRHREAASEKLENDVQDRNFTILHSQIEQAFIAGAHGALTELFQKADAQAATGEVRQQDARAAQALIRAALRAPGPPIDSRAANIALMKRYDAAQGSGDPMTLGPVIDLVNKGLLDTSEGLAWFTRIKEQNNANAFPNREPFKAARKSIPGTIERLIPSRDKYLILQLAGGQAAIRALSDQVQYNYDVAMRRFAATNKSPDAIDANADRIMRETLSEAEPVARSLAATFSPRYDTPEEVFALHAQGKISDEEMSEQIVRLVLANKVNLESLKQRIDADAFAEIETLIRLSTTEPLSGISQEAQGRTK